jgi:chemotaxis signal transduction protein
MSISEILNNQKFYKKNSTQITKSILIQFSVKNSTFATSIYSIREIIPLQNITPYPINQEGHLGVISLRGQIVPVVQYAGAVLDYKNPHQRILVFELEEGMPFCLLGEKPKRIEIDENLIQESPINISNTPVKIIHKKELLNQFGERK